MIEEDAIKDALRRAFPGSGYNEEYSAWSSCVWSIARACGYEHPADSAHKAGRPWDDAMYDDEWFQFVHDCDPEATPDWKRGDKE